MPSRGEVKRYKPKRSEGYALCNALHDGRCTCERNMTGPCSALAGVLRHCYARSIDPVAFEKARMKKDVRAPI